MGSGLPLSTRVLLVYTATILSVILYCAFYAYVPEMQEPMERLT